MTDRLDVHLYLHLSNEDPGSVPGKLDQILTLLQKGFTTMATDLAALETQVKANTDAEQSAVQLLTQLHGLLVAAQGDPARLQSVIDALGTSKEALAAAVVANTPAA